MSPTILGGLLSSTELILCISSCDWQRAGVVGYLSYYSIMVRLFGLASVALVGSTMAFIPTPITRPGAVWGVRPATVLKMSATEALETR